MPSPPRDPTSLVKSSPYSPIDSENGDIRLLELIPGEFDDGIEMRLIPSNLAHPILDYEALSYVWGTGIAMRKAKLDDIPIEITANLDCALRHLRRPRSTRVLWIDAISMNQKNTQERNHQVQVMGRIYSRARVVVIWLGPVDQSELDMKAVLSVMQFQFSSGDYSIETTFHSMCRVILLMDEEFATSVNAELCIYKVLSQIATGPWFKHIWVVQELALAQSAYIRIGPYSFLWEPFQNLINWLSQYRVSHNMCPPVQGSSICKAPQNRHFITQLLRTANRFATDPRDKVYSILGISTFASTAIVPDYTKDTCTVFSETVAILLQEGLSILYFQAPLYPQHEGDTVLSLPGLPSWVPNLTIPAPANRDGTIDDIGLWAESDTLERHPATILQCSGERVTNEQLKEISERVPFPHSRFSADYTKLIAPGVLIGIISEVERFDRGDRVMFRTRKGRRGETYHPDLIHGVRIRDYVVGLFGLNFPFILRPQQNGTFQMINVAGVFDHNWGHVFLNNDQGRNSFRDEWLKGKLPPSSWDIYRKFGMKEYIIV